MIKDFNKGITSVTYNHLNQPVEIWIGTKKTVYLYTATGMKIQTKIYEDDKLDNTTNYSGAYVYVEDALSFINIPGGRIMASNNEYQYNLTDHLGNVRVTFKEDTEGNATIIQEDHYYPFGLRMSGMHVDNSTLLNKFLYNGKELQDQTNYYDYGFRQMDPQIGRWHVIDALSEKYVSISGYAYALNDPISHIDIAGLLPDTKIYADLGSARYGDGGNMFFEGFDSRGFLDELGPSQDAVDEWFEKMDGDGSMSGWYANGGYSGSSGHWVSRTQSVLSISFGGLWKKGLGLKGNIKRLRRIKDWAISTGNVTDTWWVRVTQQDYRADLSTSETPITDIFTAYHKAKKEGKFETLFDIIKNNNYGNKSSHSGYKKNIYSGGHNYRITVIGGGKFAAKEKFGMDIESDFGILHKDEKQHWGHLDPFRPWKYKTNHDKWLYNEGYAFGFVLQSYENTYLIRIGAKSKAGFDYLKNYYEIIKKKVNN